MGATREIVRMLDRWGKQAKNPSEMVTFVDGVGFVPLGEAAAKSDVIPLGPAPAGSAGTANAVSRSDHRHPAAPYDVLRYVQAFTNTGAAASIVVAHTLGRRPLVQVIGGASGWSEGAWSAGPWGGGAPNAVLTPASIVHNSENQLTVSLAADDSGEVICIA